MKPIRTYVTALFVLFFAVHANAQVFVDAGPDVTICTGASTTLGGNPTATGGTAPYTYAWSPAAGLSDSTMESPLATPTLTTVYSVTVTDNLGATAVDQVTLTVNLNLIVDAGPDQTFTGCGLDSVILGGNPTGSGGGGNYSYLWSPSGLLNSATAANPVVDSIGNSVVYTVTVMDNNGCTGSDNVQVTVVVPVINVEAGQDVIICQGSSVVLGGSPTVTGTGLQPYTYQWFPSLTANSNPVAQPTTSTTYTAVVTDAHGCQASDTVVITVNQLPVINSVSPTDVSCFGGNDGSFCVSVSGGTPGYVYLWSNGAMNNGCISGLSAGTYAVVVTDANGCSVTATSTVTQPAQIQTPIVVGQVSCFGGSDGTLDITISGGTVPYTFNWSQGSVTEDLCCLIAGTYTVTITDANLCTATASATITQPTQLIVTETHTDVLCHGFSTGSIDVTVVGGTATYTYVWNNVSTAQDQVNVSAGTYAVTVTDNNLCSASLSITVTEPAQLTATSSHTDVTCNGANDGTLTITVGGGTAPYQFLGNPIPVGTNVIANVPPGTYSGNVFDANGCSVAISETVVEPFALSVTETHVDALCFGSNTGTIDVTASGGATPYTFIWSNFITSEDQINLSAGTYTVTVTDNNSCTATVSVTITDPTELIVDTVYIQNTTGCAISDGIVQIGALGGATPYTYALNGGPQQANAIFTGLAAGSYTVAVYDMNGCVASRNFFISSNGGLQITNITSTDASCNGGVNGSATVTVTNVTGALNLSWSNSAIGSTISGLIAGTYSVTATDASTCAVTASVTVNEPAAIVATITNNSDGILPDTLIANVTGGCAPYTYTWNPVAPNVQSNIVSSYGSYTITITDCSGCNATASTTVAAGSITVTYPNGGENLVVGQNVLITWTSTGTSGLVMIEAYSSISFNWITLAASVANTGSYLFNVPNVPGTQGKIRISDVANASIVDESDALFNIVAASNLDIYVSSCNTINTGEAYAYVSGGTPPYTYSIDGGLTFQTSDTFQNLTAGNYIAMVRDALLATDTVSFTVANHPPLILNVVAMPGADEDTLHAVASGGTTPYIYTWASGAMDSITTYYSCFSEMAFVSVTDNAGCYVQDSVLVTKHGCVWPGDADYNGVVDNNDLLPIGLGYGTTGTSRMNASLNWIQQWTYNWPDTLTTGTNYKHIDCDGNGTINADDTLAILQNFSLTHPRIGGSNDWRATDPTLYVELVPDTTHAGDTLYANLILGDVSIPAANVYGLAFTLNYDIATVDSQKTRAVFGSSWLANATDKISIAKDLKQTGEIKCALTRIDHTTRSGNGQIGQVSFVITTDNINGKNFSYYPMKVWISDLVMTDNNGTYLPVNAGSDSTNVEFEPLSVGNGQLTVGRMSIQPNPATDWVLINVSENLMGAELRLSDVEGRCLRKATLQTSIFKLETGNLETGVYLLQAITPQGTITKRMIIAR